MWLLGNLKMLFRPQIAYCYFFNPNSSTLPVLRPKKPCLERASQTRPVEHFWQPISYEIVIPIFLSIGKS